MKGKGNFLPECGTNPLPPPSLSLSASITHRIPASIQHNFVLIEKLWFRKMDDEHFARQRKCGQTIEPREWNGSEQTWMQVFFLAFSLLLLHPLTQLHTLAASAPAAAAECMCELQRIVCFVCFFFIILRRLIQTMQTNRLYVQKSRFAHNGRTCAGHTHTHTHMHPITLSSLCVLYATLPDVAHRRTIAQWLLHEWRESKHHQRKEHCGEN